MSGCNARVRQLQRAYSTSKKLGVVEQKRSTVTPIYGNTSLGRVPSGANSLFPDVGNGRKSSSGSRRTTPRTTPRNPGSQTNQGTANSSNAKKSNLAHTGKQLLKRNPNVNWDAMFQSSTRTKNRSPGKTDGKDTSRRQLRKQRKASSASVDMIFNAMREIETGSFGSRSRTPRFSQDLSPAAFITHINSLSEADREESLEAMFRNLKQYRSLLEVTSLISVELDSRDALKQIINSTYSVVSAERVTLFLVNQQQKSITMVLSRDGEQVVFPIGQGLAGTVAETHEVLVIEDAYSDPRFDPSVDRKTGFKTHNMIVLPILDIYGECSAVLQCINRLDDSGKIMDFRKEDSFLLQIVGASAGHCIHKLRVTEEALAHQEKTSVLLRAMKAIQSEGDVNQLIERLIAVAYDMMRCDRITLYLCDKSRRELWCAIISPDTVGFRIPFGMGIAGTVAETGQMLNITDAYKDERFIRDVDVCTGYRTRSILAMPILDGGDVVGVLQLINKFADSNDSVLPPLDENEVANDCRLSNIAALQTNQSLKRLSLVPMTPNEDVGSHAEEETKEENLEAGAEGSDSKAEPISKERKKLLEKRDMVLDKKDNLQSKLRTESMESDDQGSLGITTFNSRDVNLCESFCSEIGAALRRKVVEVRFKKVIADLSQTGQVSGADGSQQLIKSLLSTHTSNKVQSSKSLGSFSHAFRAIGKFRLKLKRIRGPRFANETVDNAIKNIDVALIMTRTLPNQAFIDEAAAFPAQLHQQSEHQQHFSSFDFDVLEHQGGTLVGLCNYVFQRTGLITRYRIQSRTMLSFLLAVKSAYFDKPYHNFHHAVFVFHQVFAVMINTKATDFLLFSDILALLVSAICHDIGHPGHTNDFEIQTRSELAITYNDQSVLEHHHAATTFRILSTPSNNILDRVSGATFSTIRKGIIALILSTDMKKHFDLVKDAREELVPADHTIVRGSAHLRDKFGAFLLHCCDIGAQTMPVEIATKWGMRVIQEFMEQAKNEVQLNLEPTPHMHGLNDPHKHSQVQAGFIEYIVKPAIELMVAVLPGCKGFLPNLEENLERFRRPVPVTKQGSTRDIPILMEPSSNKKTRGSISSQRKTSSLSATFSPDDLAHETKQPPVISDAEEGKPQRESGAKGFVMRGRVLTKVKSKSATEAGKGSVMLDT